MAGYLGSSLTMSYSVIGDTVNVASRLCAAANPGEIIISEYTQFIVQDEFIIKQRDSVQAKGKTFAVKAFSVIGDRKQPVYGNAGLQNPVSIPRT